MAALRDIGALTDELILLVSKSDDKNTLQFRSLRAHVDRVLKAQSFVRTNQFEVSNTLNGLQEKFRVLNNDALADNLHNRLSELAAISTSWTPEVLSLLIQLSDKPATKTRLGDLQLQRAAEETRPLTWEDLDAEDPLPKHDAIWQDVDFAADTSDDDDERYSFSNDSSSEDEYIGESDTEDTSESLHEQIFSSRGDEKMLKSINDAQFWNSTGKFDSVDLRHNWEINAHGKRVRLSEPQIVREFIFMLQGLPTSLFRKANGSLQLNISYTLRHSSERVLHSLMDSFAQIALRLDKLRLWCKRPQENPLAQTFHQEVEGHLAGFDAELSKIQAKIISPSDDTVISLGALFRDVLRISKPILGIEKVVSELDDPSLESSDFGLLEQLYDSSCSYQLIGDQNSYFLMAKLFLKCFRTYIKPVRRWLESGETAHIGGLILSKDRTKSMNLLWQNWYELKKNSEGIYAPKFLLPVVKDLFITGKSVLFLQQLGISPEDCKPCDDQKLSYEQILDSSTFPMFTPFSELFANAVKAWFEERSESVSVTLRHALDYQCGLWFSLDALELIYFARNGSLAKTIDQRIFHQIDRGIADWKDRYILTELLRSAYDSIPAVSTESIVALIIETSSNERRSRNSSVKALDGFAVGYALPFAVANIIPKHALRTYQRISTFLMKIRRANFVLARHRLRPSCRKQEGRDIPPQILEYTLRHRLLWFNNVVYSYLTDHVLQISTAKMRSSLAKANDLEAMTSVHAAYMKRLEAQCLLSMQLTPICDAIILILDLCLEFSNAQTAHLHSADSKSQGAPSPSPQIPPQTEVRDQRRKSLAQIGIGDDAFFPSSDDEVDNFDDSDSVSDADEEESRLPPSRERTYEEHLRQILKQCETLCGFVTAGLRGVARSGAKQAEWEILAEKLDWKKEPAFH